MKVTWLQEKKIIITDMKEVYNTRVLRKGLSGTLKQPDNFFETYRVFLCLYTSGEI